MRSWFCINELLSAEKTKTQGELLIVDPADHAQEIFSRIREMQAKPAAILLTHGHYDHILAVEDVKKRIPDSGLCL